MAEAITCRKAGCVVANTGACAEGHRPAESCPNYGLLPEEIEEEINEGEENGNDEVAGSAESEKFKLGSGDALDSAEVEAFQLWREPMFVVVMGDTASGKTTLIGAIYDRYMRGPFADCSFVGSRTLIGFEKWWYQSRIDSGRNEPNTDHTSRQRGLRYFHLALKNERRTDLLISDRAGEVYREARDQTAVIAGLEEFKSAHRVVMLLDGARVVSLSEQTQALQATRQSLRAFLDEGALGATSHVAVVVTKYDLVSASNDRALIEGRLDRFGRDLERDFASRLGSLRISRIAARPINGGLEASFGLDELIRDWAAIETRSVELPLPKLQLSTEFERLLERRESR